MQKAHSQQQSEEATAGAAVRESSSSPQSPPSPPDPPQHTDSTDTEGEEHCPICLESWKEPSFVIPCLHRFCYICILQWADSKAECPFCKRRMTSILHSVHADDDFVEHVLAPSAAPPLTVLPRREANREPDPPNFHDSGARPQRTAARDIQHLMGGFQLPNWMSWFSTNPAIFQTLRSWVYQNLEPLFGTSRDQPSQTTEQQHHREGHHGPLQQDTSGATGQEGSPSPPAPAPPRPSTEEIPGTSSTATGGGRGTHPSAPANIHMDVPANIHVEQEESQEETGRACTGPPNSTGGSDPSPRGLRRPPKRKASSPEDSPAHRRSRH